MQSGDGFDNITSKVLESWLSRRERSVCKAIIAVNSRGVPATRIHIYRACCIPRTDVNTLVRNLCERGIVREECRSALWLDQPEFVYMVGTVGGQTRPEVAGGGTENAGKPV